MQRSTWMAAVAGIATGLVAGWIAWGRMAASPPPPGSAFLRGFSLPEIPGAEGGADGKGPGWEVLDDRIEPAIPAFSRSPRVARRLVARMRMDPAQVDRFATGFPNAVSSALDGVGAVNKYHLDVVTGSSVARDGRMVHSRVHLPRRAYALGEVHGVVDAGYVAEDGAVTAIVFIEEGW